MRERRQWEPSGGWCSYCLVNEWGQDDDPLHGVHHHSPELLQDSLQHCLLTHSGKQREATDTDNRWGWGKYGVPAPQRLPCPKASALPFLSECYSLAIQEIHERSQHTICILSHRGSGVRGCIPCASYLAQDVSHLSNTLVDPHLEATICPQCSPPCPPH